MESIIELDKTVFLWIHLNLQNSILDFWAPLFREKLFWIPFYVFLFTFLLLRDKRLLFRTILAVILLIFISDTVSSKVVKPTFQRLRPCKEVKIRDVVRPIVACGSGFSFTSSHATNHFALATFLVVGISHFFRRYKVWLWAWAGLIAFSQIYVGVHYPGDVIFGALLGFMVGWSIGRLFERYMVSGIKDIHANS